MSETSPPHASAAGGRVIVLREPEKSPEGAGSGLRIAADGAWSFRNMPITNTRVLKLYASALKREGDGQYFLVAPCEKIHVRVDDAPFSAVELNAEGKGREQILRLRTNLGEVVEVGRRHPLRFSNEVRTGGLKPYILIRDGLEARLTRSVAIELSALGQAEPYGGQDVFGVWSAGVFFPMCALAAMEESGSSS